MRAWWWRSVAACASLAAVASTVAVVTAAISADQADRTHRELALAAEQSHQPRQSQQSEQVPADVGQPGSPPRADPPRADPGRVEPGRPSGTTPAGGAARPADARVGDPALGASVTVPAGWRRVPDQRLVPVPAGRFPLVLAPNDRAAVLVGTLDPARVGTPADPARLEAEARRLVGAFAEGTAPDARPAELTDAADTVDGRRAWTSLRRADGGPRDLAGTLVRVTAVEGAPRGVVAVAVARPGPGQAPDSRAADAIVRSLDLGGGGPGGRPAEVPRPAPVAGPARLSTPRPAGSIAPRPVSPRPIPPRPVSPGPNPPRPTPPRPTPPPGPGGR